MADQVKAPLYAPDGKPAGEAVLDPEIFGVEPNLPLMHQVVTAQMAAARSGTADTKTRNEVRGGGRKPWRQKMTGRARHGSIRSPIWVGGGIAFGPHPRDYAQRTPKKMKRLALRGALSARASEGSVRVVQRIDWPEPKTKRAVALLDAIDASGKVLVVVGSGDAVVERSFRNLPRVKLMRVDQLAAYDVLWSDVVVFTQDTLAAAGGKAYEVSEEDFVKEESEGEG